MNEKCIVRRAFVASGQVQGVGFRPFVYRLAHEGGLTGTVGNTSEGVRMEVQGAEAEVRRFGQRLQAELPPLARLTGLKEEELPPVAQEDAFAIVQSSGHAGHSVLVSPDVGVCADCLADMADPQNPRYNYPFTNCTNCGPRYTITRSIPYDRAVTSMSCFPLCPRCSAEYANPADRRFHAQPVACPVCGPQLAWKAGAKAATGEAALAATLAALRAGGIVALRGIGGYHLVCDARNEAAVAALRERKQRPSRPFAVLFADADDLAASDDERALLQSPQRPIVLVEAKIQLAPSVAPGLNRIGAMLPYSPLHVLLLDDFDGPLVAKPYQHAVAFGAALRRAKNGVVEGCGRVANGERLGRVPGRGAVIGGGLDAPHELRRLIGAEHSVTPCDRQGAGCVLVENLAQHLGRDRGRGPWRRARRGAGRASGQQHQCKHESRAGGAHALPLRRSGRKSRRVDDRLVDRRAGR